jgi:hypothetical protein
MTPFTTAELGLGATAVSGRKRRLGTKARDALELLAAPSCSCWRMGSRQRCSPVLCVKGSRRHSPNS